MPRDPRDIVGRGMGFPIDVDADGSLKWSVPMESPTDEDRRKAIEACILHVVLTIVGQRVLIREFGSELTRSLFGLIQPAYVAATLQRMVEAIHRWEPRIEISGATPTADAKRGIVEFQLSWRLSNKSLDGQAVIPIGFDFKEVA